MKKRSCAYASQYRVFVMAGLLLLFAGTGLSAQTQRMVFAHYMVTNQDYQGDTDPTQELKIAAYEREIQQAQAIGIDGFALNAGGWLNQTYYIRYSAQIFEAAVRLNSGFKLMFSADMCCGNGINDVEDMMRRFANNPRYSQVYFKHNGKFVLTTFSGDQMGTSFWQQVKSDLATGANPSTTVESTVLAQASGAPSNAPLNIELVTAFFWGGEIPILASIQQGFNQWSSTIDGSFYWGIAGVPGSGGSLDQIPSSEAYASVLHGAGKLYMAPICLQFWGANANRYYEYSGAAGMRKMWMDAINVSHPDWVEIITWNDFIEGSYVSPIDDPNKYQFANFLNTTGVPLGTLGYFHSHMGATALLPYFIQWYKTGIQPAITNDSIYWFYRTQSMNTNAGTPAVSPSTNHGPMADVIYVTANVAAPAVLKVTSGSMVTTLNVPTGSTDVQAPFVVGTTPTFELDRSGTAVIPATAGTDAIQASPQFNDYYYSTGFVNGPSFNAPPSTPTGLTASAGNQQVALSWQASTGSVPLTYNIYRGTASGAEGSSPIATGISSTSFTDSGLTNNTTYFYKVKGVNSLGVSGFSNEASATPVAPTPPSVPTGLTATAGDAQVKLSWNSSSGTLPIAYNVYRGTGSGNESSTPIATGLSSTSFTDTGLANGTKYFYQVSATNIAATSSRSSEASAQTLFPVIQINAGGGAVAPFVADTDFNTGNQFSSGAQIDVSGTTNPAPQGVYQTVRWAPTFNYTIGGLTANSSYLLRLHFCDLSFNGSGQRVFNVAVNGANVLSNFDIVATAGAMNKAVIKEFTIAADSSGRILVAFTQGTADNPEIAGIEVFGAAPGSPPPPPPPPPVLTPVLQIDSGSGNGVPPFRSDIDFSSGNMFSSGAAINTSGVANAAPAAVYQTVRWAPSFNYTIGGLTANSSYVLRLHFCELSFGGSGQRVFNVAVNGSNVLSNFDIVATAGAMNKAVVKEFTVNSDSSGRIVIAFTQGPVDNPEIAGIEVLSTTSSPPPPPPPPPALTPVLQIDSGSSSDAPPFTADVDFNGGNMFSSGAAIDTSGAANPAPAAVYQTVRWAPSFSYTIPGLNPGGSYTVRLHFAELTWTAVGQRKFNVAINGATALSAFDIFAAAGGKNRAITQQFVTTASSSGQIVISFTQAGVDNPEINGIEILH